MILAALVRASSSSAIARFSSTGTAEPSHMCDWKSGFSTVLDPLGGDGEQRPDEAVELRLRTVVGVQGDGDRVVLGHLVRVRRERDAAGDHVLHRGAGGVLAAAGGHLHDAVGAGLGEALQGGVQGLRGADVDGGVGEVAGLRLVDHLGVDLGSCDGHCVTLSAREPNRRRQTGKGQSVRTRQGADGSYDPMTRGVGGLARRPRDGRQFSRAARSTPNRPPEYARAVLSRVAGKTSSWSSGTDSE